jgi:hypothetical protein
VPFGDMHRRQKRKNIAVLVALLALMLVFFAVTLIRFGAPALQP